MFMHFILTRFNLETPGREQTHRTRVGWLERRIALFERYCLPSVEAQTNRNFTWLIYFDVRTPDEYAPRLDAYAARPFIALRTVDGLAFSTDNVREDICNLAHRECAWIMTTRLDNDDAIRRTFIDTLQSAFAPTGRYVLNFTHGLILQQGRVYRVTDRSNAFATLVEPADVACTVWSRQHTDLRLLAPVRQVGSEPMWLQVIHEDNVSNRKRGVRDANPASWTRDFPIADAELQPAPRWAVMKENTVDAPWQWLLFHAKATVRDVFHRVEAATGWSPTEALRRLRERRR